MAGGARALARLRVHPHPEVWEPLLGDLPIGKGNLPRVLLEAVEQDEEIAGALAQKAIPGIRESNPQLA